MWLCVGALDRRRDRCHVLLWEPSHPGDGSGWTGIYGVLDLPVFLSRALSEVALNGSTLVIFALKSIIFLKGLSNKNVL